MPNGKPIAARVFSWFLGGNDLSVALVDSETGSCRDGLHPDRANENRGGESVVSYLLGAGRDAPACARQCQSDEPRGASRHRCLSSAFTHANANRGHLVASHFPQSAGALSASRSRARDRAPVQAGDRTARSQPDRQDARQPYRRARSRISIRRPRPANWPTCWRISRAGTATCWRRSSAAPTKWKRRCWRTARFPKCSAS